MLLPWIVRLAWLSLPLTAGAVLADAAGDRSRAVAAVIAVVSWAVWAAVVLALLVRRPLGLTVARCAAPAALAAALWAAADTGHGAALALLTAVPVLLLFLPETGAWLVNGAAYGYERRYPLRAPGALLLGPIPLAEVVLVAGAVSGPLLLAARQWVAGTIVLAVGWAAAAVCARALHQLSTRWAVLVPAGLVVKDHVTLVDPTLYKRAEIELLAPAPAGTDALDLTARSPGLALELRLHQALPLVVVRPGREPQPGKSAKLMFTPTRPGALLADAAERRIRVGSLRQAAVPPPSTSSPS